jgi:uncharacterized protein (TIGR02391 family)
MDRSFYSIISDADELLSLEPEELAVAVLEFLKASDSQVLNRYNFGLYHTVAEYPRSKQAEILRALMEAWVWLENVGFIAHDPDQQGDWVFITRKGQKIKERSDFESFKNSSSLSKHLLHPIIVQKSWSPFIRGEYETAVFQAFREVEIQVRGASGLDPEDIGVQLMRKAFDSKAGPLIDHTLTKGEKEALGHLFAGAIGLYKNPSSHRQVDMKVAETSELLMLASHLMRIIDLRTKK